MNSMGRRQVAEMRCMRKRERINNTAGVWNKTHSQKVDTLARRNRDVIYI